jgi:hypothetical protein
MWGINLIQLPTALAAESGLMLASMSAMVVMLSALALSTVTAIAGVVGHWRRSR